MLEKEKVLELKILNKQGQSMKAIARVSGAARNTVRDSATAVRKVRSSRQCNILLRLAFGPHVG